MYTITKIKNQGLTPVKNWKWTPKSGLPLSRHELKAFSKFMSSRKIGVQWVHGRGY